MGLFYILVGIKHFQNPEWFIPIVPPILPYKLVLVYISGFFEIFFGVILFIPKLIGISFAFLTLIIPRYVDYLPENF